MHSMCFVAIYLGFSCLFVVVLFFPFLFSFFGFFLRADHLQQAWSQPRTFEIHSKAA